MAELAQVKNTCAIGGKLLINAGTGKFTT